MTMYFVMFNLFYVQQPCFVMCDGLPLFFVGRDVWRRSQAVVPPHGLLARMCQERRIVLCDVRRARRFSYFQGARVRGGGFGCDR